MNRRTTEPAPWSLPNSSNDYGAPNTVGGGVWLSVFNFRSSIQAQMTLSFIAVSAFVLLVVSVFAAIIAKDVIEDTVVDDLSAIASIQSARVEQILGNTLENLEYITADSRVRNTLRHYIATNDLADRGVLSQIISDRAASSENIETIDLFNLNGKLVMSSNFESLDRSHVDPRVEGFVFSSSHLGEDHYLSDIHVSAPFVFDGNVIGYATVHSNTDQLKSISNTYTGLRKSEEIVLLTNDSDGVGRFITPVRFGTEDLIESPVSTSSKLTIEQEALARSLGSGTNYLDYRGERVMAVHRSIDDFGISLIVKIDYDEAMSRLSSDIGMFLLVIPVILLGVVVAAYFLAKRLLNPITNLTKSAELFTRGQYDTRLAIESNDEIGILAHTFNGMAKSIQEANSKLESRVEERTADLRRSNQDLEQFAYVASHDLQEPLRMVSSYTQLLSRRYTGKLDSDADEFIGFAVDGAKRMQGLINDLLIYSRAGRSDGIYEEIDTAEVVGEALRNLGDRLKSSNGEVTLGELPNIVADRQQLVSIFQNLLSNSIKYRSASRDPRITITAERTTKAWKFAIKDNGIGINSAFTDRIFTIFQRLHGRDEYQGTGIGLAVVKKVVERANGQIWVESEPDERSTFIFTVIDRVLEGDSNQNNEGSDLSVAS